MVLKIGSRAAEFYEPRQIREEAAVNSNLWVPRERLIGATWRGQARAQDQRWVHDPYPVDPRRCENPHEKLIST